jgi:hypothetical protein
VIGLTNLRLGSVALVQYTDLIQIEPGELFHTEMEIDWSLA